jgi:Fe-S cluster assembly protein SufD
MMDVAEEKDVYLESFARLDRMGASPNWLRQLRQEAMERFTELGFPQRTDEEWRFTNLTPLTKIPFALSEESGSEPAKELLADAVLDPGSGPRLVFVNGRFDSALSQPAISLAGSDRIQLDIFGKTCEPELKQWLAQYASYLDHAFIALNTAFLSDGAFIRIPRGFQAREPIHIVFLSTNPGEPTASHPRLLIVAEPESRATVLESYAGPEDGTYFTNAVTEIVVQDQAAIDHYKIQREGRQAFHVATLQAFLGRAANFRTHMIGLGGALVRNEVNAVAGDEGSECTLNGLYLSSGSQHMDNRTFIDHAKPHCTSHELYKGVLDGQARGVFNGKIRVAQDAQKTDAKQTNKTLLLSDDAQINTKPQLEIYADDVKCTHGATVGQLSDEALFYLRSRGIGLESARGLLTFAFANDIITRIQIEAVRERLEEMLLTRQHLPRDEHLGVSP